MKRFLPARPLLLSVLLLVLALFTRPVLASHLLGGELTYRYLDSDGPDAAPLRYELVLTVYNNCNPDAIAPATTAEIAFYYQATGQRIIMTTANYGVLTSSNNINVPTQPLGPCVTPIIPAGCTITGPSQPYILQKFTATVNLPSPVQNQGFYAVYTQNARNTGINNLAGSSGQNMTLATLIAPPAIPNRSPVFANIAVAVICANDTTFYLNNAIDADGDRLEYSFGRPYGGTGLPGSPLTQLANIVPVPYANTTFSATSPFGTGTGIVSQLNAATGIAALSTPTIGKYVVAVDVNEYRTINGVEQLIGTTRRDVQLVVASCPPVPAPRLPAANLTPREYTITAGSSLTIPISATQSDGHPLTMTVSSELLDGPGGYNATFNGGTGSLTGLVGTAKAIGNSGSVSGSFTYASDCSSARTTPYDIAVQVQDDGCAGKTVFDIFRITVVAPTAPTAIAGNALVCGAGTTASYTASGGNAGGVLWTVTGGTIVGSNTANPVQVQWGATGTGTISVQGRTAANCTTTSISRTITIAAPPTLTATGNRTICAGASTTITVSGAATGNTYTVTGGPVSGTSPTFVLTPTATTTYTITSSTTATGTCPATTQVTVTVNPLPAANPGTVRATCSNVPLALGATAVAGNTYLWSPATGLSSATVANPTLTLANTTGAAFTRTYTLTETSAAGCVATSTVVITINPAAVAVAGAAVAACSSSPVQLGAAAVAGNTYSWSPTTGLSSATVANPTVTLTNSGSAPTTQTYTLTTTNATGCSATSTVAVTVYPVVVPAVGATTVTTIGGRAVSIGAAPVAGFTYRWSPATGLSSSTVANPTVLQVNYTGAPIVQTYTLTTTNTATGCTGTATVTVTINVDETLVIYNVITPNGDGLNDKLQIANVLSFPGNSMEIYNRWGRQVFSTTSYNNDTNAWGTDPSIAPGLYYYLFKKANGNATKGWVEVVK